MRTVTHRPATHADHTRQQILHAAGEIFARHGFHAATVRQITQHAGVNLAAVNYHFHDKHELYFEALKHAHQAAQHTAVADFVGPAEERLRVFVSSFMGYLLDPRRPAWQGQLIAREMAEPSDALDRLIKESILPIKNRLLVIVRELFGPKAPELQIQLTCISIVGQCLHYVHSRELIRRLFPQNHAVHRDVEGLASHIADFSLAGIEALRDKSQKASRSPSRSSLNLHNS